MSDKTSVDVQVPSDLLQAEIHEAEIVKLALRNAEGCNECKPCGAEQQSMLPGSNHHSSSTSTSRGKKIIPWNWNLDDDSFVRVAHEHIYRHKDAPQIIKKVCNFILGNGEIKLFKKDENGKVNVVMDKDLPPEICEFICGFKSKKMLSDALRASTKNFISFGNYFVQFIPNVKGDAIVAIKNMDAQYCRAGELKDGVIENYYIYTNRNETNRLQPYGKPESIRGFTPNVYSAKRIRNFLYHGMECTPYNDYYGLPPWIGSVDQLALQKLLIDYYTNGLKNGFNIKYIISFHPLFYQGLKKEEMKLKRDEWVKNATKFLSGTANVGKAIGVDMVRNHIKEGGFTNLVEIESVKTSNTDSVYKELLSFTTNNAGPNFGISSLLAGVEKQGAISSGSEMLNQYNVHMAINVPNDRKIILEPINLIFELNGWNKKYGMGKLFDYIGFEDMKLTYQSENKTGKDESSTTNN